MKNMLSIISEMIDSLIEADVEPMICLEHYEVPAFLLKNMMAGLQEKWLIFMLSTQRLLLIVMVTG